MMITIMKVGKGGRNWRRSNQSDPLKQPARPEGMVQRSMLIRLADNLPIPGSATVSVAPVGVSPIVVLPANRIGMERSITTNLDEMLMLRMNSLKMGAGNETGSNWRLETLSLFLIAQWGEGSYTNEPFSVSELVDGHGSMRCK